MPESRMCSPATEIMDCARPRIAVAVALLFLLAPLALSQSTAFCGLQHGSWKVWTAQPSPSEGTVYAKATYNASFLDIGWDTLHVAAVAGSDPLAAYAAGLCEGYLTQARAAQMIRNSDSGTPYDNLTNAFLDTNEKWMRQQIAENPQDAYWAAISLILQQLQGMADGYTTARQPSDPVVDFEFLRKFNLDQGDVYDVQCIVNKSLCATTHPSSTALPPSSRKKTRLFSAARGHCTSLLKFAPGYQDLYVGHTTWDDYFSALRIWKVYDLPFAASNSSRVGMSSYPLTVVSSDDFVYTNQQIAIVSSEIFPPCPNPDVWSGIQPVGIVWTYLRNAFAARAASSAPGWAAAFGKYQSSTYNNEWFVVDYKKFTAGQLPPPDTVWLVDQMPKQYTAYDVTANITSRKGAWLGSWNIQSDDTQFAQCGWPAFIEETRAWGGDDIANDYTHCCQARALLIQRLQDGVVTLEDFQALCRHNDYVHDPESMCNCTAQPSTPCKGVSSRCDLSPAAGMGVDNYWGGQCFGGYDSKAISASMMKSFTARAQSGPSHDNVPKFNWTASESCAGLPHEGFPELWAFDWVTFDAPVEWP